MLGELGEKMGDEDKNALASKINDLREDLKTHDIGKVRGSLDALKNEFSRISAKLYGADGKAGPSGFSDAEPGQGPMGQDPDAEV